MAQTTFPLHTAQFDIYIDQLINIESPHYNLGKYLKLKGPLDTEAFQKAINSSPETFDVFKMRFDLGDSNPQFYFDENFNSLELETMDLSDRIDPQQVAISWMQKRFNTPFSIQKKNPLFEFVLIKIAHNEHWFFVRYHHLITDEYGLVIWVNYIAKKYKALISGSNLHVNYPSYKEEALKASEYRNSELYVADGIYWKDKIGDKPEPLLNQNIATSTKRIRKQGTYFFKISEDKQKSLDELVNITKSNLHQLTIAALLIYYGKISEQSEIVFGLPVHKRGLGELRNTLGLFSGVLPFKGLFKEDIKLKDLLKDIASARKEDYLHENYLTVDMLRLLKINSTESHLYDVIINYIQLNFELNFGNEIQSEIFSIQSEYDSIPLQLTWADYGEKQPLELRIQYSYDDFTAKEVALFAERVIFILDQFQFALDMTIGTINILPPEEEKLIKNFNPFAVPSQKEKSVSMLFEEQATLNPNAIALICGEQHLTYSELNERSNQLAHYLRIKGVNEERIVPICIERSPEMIIGLLGIIKSGGAFLPIDPEYPPERIDYMLEDCKAHLMLTGNHDLISDKIKIDKIDLFKDWSIINKQASTNLKTSFNANNLAYVIYTSGSTGKPKGVMIKHISLLNYISVFKDYFSINKNDVVIQQASISFDTSIEEIYPALISGGCVCIIKDRRDPEKIKQYIENGQATILSASPMIIEWLNKELSTIGNLRYVIPGGDLLHISAIDKLVDKVTVVNSYGPSETAIAVTFNKIKSIQDAPLIGKPIANCYVYILDKQNRIQPIGARGEIHIGGVQISKGYLNQPELTDEKFIKDPFNANPDSIIYKTGDMGCWLPDGNILFTGRKDNQVKIRGNRIELGEIENILLQNEQIKQGVVLTKENKASKKQLIGYLVTKKDKLDRKALKTYLVSKLPQYMIPEIWIELDSLPLTESGKIDRKALTEAYADENLKTVYEAPRNEMEAKLCSIWQELLKVENISIHDNFFELGGDSMTSIYVVSKVKNLGYSMQVKDLFLHQTINALSKAMLWQSSEEFKQKQVLSNGKHSESFIPAKIGNNKMPLYIICGGGGTVLKFRKFIEFLDKEQSVYVLQQPTETKDLATFPTDIQNIASRYVSEILAHDPDGPYAISGHCIGGIIGFEMAKQMEAMGKKIALLAMFDTILNKENIHSSQLSSNANNYKPELAQTLGKIYSKIHFETFLFTKHTKHAIEYKTKAIRASYKKFILKKSRDKEKDELNIYAEQEDTFESAYNNYEITPYMGRIVVFYAKDHYHFVDKDKNISYRKFYLSKIVKDRWKAYSKSAIFHEIEGEHSSMFDPAYGGKELAKKLQEHIEASKFESN